jgi:membrane protein YqaA with SNARE-associated domain
MMWNHWRRFATSHAGVRTMFAWAVAEASVWPLIPDFLLAPLVAADPRCFARPLIAGATGSLMGSSATYLLARFAPRRMRRIVGRVPLVYESHFSAVEQAVRRDGTRAFLMQPWSRTPSKVWYLVGAAEGLPARKVLPTVVAARTFRMLVVALAARFIGKRFAKVLRRRFLPVAVVYATFFVFLWQPWRGRDTRQN